MMKQDINNDLKILFSFEGQVTPLTIENNLKIPLGSKPGKFKNDEDRQIVRYTYLFLNYTHFEVTITCISLDPNAEDILILYVDL